MLLPLLFAPLAFCLLLRPCPHSIWPGHLEPPVEIIFLRRFPPSRLATGHAAFPAGTAAGTELPGSTQLPQVHRLGSGNVFRNFLNGVAVAWLISHHLSKLSTLPQEFKAVQTNSLARLSSISKLRLRKVGKFF